ncbi:MAG: hypothetical protein Aurels2KO_50960 [Aureliella sp.]
MPTPKNRIQDTYDIAQLKKHDLVRLGEEIRKAASAAESHLKESVVHALQAGELLCAAKERIQHGGWSAWFTECNFQFGERTAQRYMRLFQKWQIYVCESGLESNPTQLSDLTLTAFLDLHAKSLSPKKLIEPNSARKKPLTLPEASSDWPNTQEPRRGCEAAESRDCDGSWQIPDEIAGAVELVLGTVDLAICDGSSCGTSRLTHCSTPNAAIDHRHSWLGSVFLFPAPTSKLLPKLSARLLKEHEQGSVVEAIIIVPAHTGENWFRGFRQYMRCFLASKFATEFGERRDGFAAVYLGDRTRRFYEVFEKFGDCFVPFCARHIRHIGSLDLDDVE